LCERTCMFSGIQLTKHFIEFVLVETRKLVGSNPNVILTRQTCGQRSGMAAGSKRRAIAFYFSVRICNMFLILKCKEESDLGPSLTSGLAKRMRLCGRDLRRILWPNTLLNRKSPLLSCTFFLSPEVMHRPRSDSPLHFDVRSI